MSQSRRDALVFLGLTGAGSAAIGTMAMGEPMEGHYAMVGQPIPGKTGGVQLEKVSTALRKLADGIDSGEVNFIGMRVNSELKPGTWVTQVLNIEFEVDDTVKKG